jgi:hypothetical protein
MRNILLTLFLLLQLHVNAQELWGASNSNYAGNTGLDLNPASVTGAPFKWEIHLLSADASVMNNYMYLMNNSNAIRASVRGESVDQERFTDRYTTKDKSAYASVFLKLPSLMYSNNKFGVAFHISNRTALSARNIPYHLAKFIKEGFDYAPQHDVRYTGGKTAIALMNWNEAGITGGMALLNDQTTYISGGLTVNYLYGLNSAYLNINNIDYMVPSDSLWQIYNADIEYGHAIPSENADGNEILKKKGSGIGVSAGLQYYHNRNEDAYNPCTKEKNQKKYDYKVGFSIIDVGKINYNVDAKKYIFNNVSTDWFGIDTTKLNGLSGADSTLNSQFYALQDPALAGTSYDLWLPAAASLQLDYSVTPNIYFNFSAIQRLPLNRNEIKRANQLSVAVRYETKNFEVALPYSFFDYYRHRLGLSLRYGPLTVGTDMIGPFTGLFDTYGMDIYFALKWQLSASCNKKVKTPKAKNNKITDCFNDF